MRHVFFLLRVRFAPHEMQSHLSSDIGTSAGAAVVVAVSAAAFARFSASVARLAVSASFRIKACLSRSNVFAGAAACAARDLRRRFLLTTT